VAFLHGLGFGLLMMFFIGPVFFYLLQVSLQHGTRSGMAAAIGIFISDITAVVLCYFWAIKLFENPASKFWLSLVGGIILVFFGLGYIFKPKLPAANQATFKKADYAGFFTKAFLINFVNPFVFAVWTGMIGLAKSTYPSNNQVIVFMSAALLGIITTDSLKVFGSKYLKRVIEPHFLRKLYKGIGVLLIGFSIRLFIEAAKHY
jgi:threonine/homoserine/homoserine lactone efflux protein